jgi:hypothetical protein
MTYNTKAIVIESFLIIGSGILTVLLAIFFDSRGLSRLTQLTPFIPTTVMGLYILFGKYVYFKGPLTKLERIIWGVFFLLMVPVIFVIMKIARVV